MSGDFPVKLPKSRSGLVLAAPKKASLTIQALMIRILYKSFGDYTEGQKEDFTTSPTPELGERPLSAVGREVPGSCRQGLLVTRLSLLICDNRSSGLLWGSGLEP